MLGGGGGGGGGEGGGQKFNLSKPGHCEKKQQQHDHSRPKSLKKNSLPHKRGAVFIQVFESFLTI